MDVAMLGTGKMGAAMPRRLHDEGHALHLWNRTPERAPALGFGAVHAAPAEAARASSVVMAS